MKDKIFILAFIPARGGSKGIPKKNIIKLNNKPLIQYTLDLCRSNLNVDDYFVSTDSMEIKKILSKLDYTNEYKRPKYLANDTASIVDTVLHGVKWYEKSKKVKVHSTMAIMPAPRVLTPKRLECARTPRFFKHCSCPTFVHVSKPLGVMSMPLRRLVRRAFWLHHMRKLIAD